MLIHTCVVKGTNHNLRVYSLAVAGLPRAK